MYQDIKNALRSLYQHPALTANVTLVLAVGIGASTAIFSVVDGVLLRPPYFADAERLVMIWQTDRESGTTREPASVPDYVDFKARATQFGEIAAFAGVNVTLSSFDGDAQRLAAMAITHEFLPVAGISPLLGRGFTEAENAPDGAAVALISEELWQRSFGGDSAVLGATVHIDDVPRTIVGVLARDADFGMSQIHRSSALQRGFGGGDIDVWVPMRLDPGRSPRAAHGTFMIGRLGQSASVASAQQEASTIMAELERTHRENAARGANVESLTEIVFAPVRPALGALLGAAGFLLLVACANVANALLVRGAARARELAVRVVLGARAGRLARQFLVESLVLTFSGAIGGAVVAFLTLDVLLAFAPHDVPRVADVTINGRALAVALALSVVIGLVFGMLPTTQARRLDLNGALHGSSRTASASIRRRRFASGIVVIELALAVMLLVGAALLITTLLRLQNVDPGFDPTGVLKAEYQLPGSRYPQSFANFPNWPEVRAFNNELLARLQALPNVEVVALAGAHPLDAGSTSSISVPGREAEAENWPEPAVRSVSADYFRALRVPVLQGDAFDASADAGAPNVILINDAARERYFGVQDPVGQRVTLMGQQRMVIGVVANERIYGVATPAPPAIYAPLAQLPSFVGRHSIHVRASGDLDGLLTALRGIVREFDPSLPLYNTEMLTQTLAGTMRQQSFMMLIITSFAAAALLLAIFGVYGVLSYTVAQRTHEIGIRMALGADVARVGSLVMREGALLAACGIGLGLVGALALRGVLAAFLYGVGPSDPATLGGVAVVLAAAALLATYLPARRATRVDPLRVMRAE